MPVEIGKTFVRRRKMSPSRCAPRSFRMKTLSRKHKIVICCPKGKWSRRAGRCKVGMKTQSVLTKRR